VRGADEYLKDPQTDLSIAASDPEVHDLQGKTHKTEPPAFPDVDPSSPSISQINEKTESAPMGDIKEIFNNIRTWQTLMRCHKLADVP